jgi:hypothetical protein
MGGDWSMEGLEQLLQMNVTETFGYLGDQFM